MYKLLIPTLGFAAFLACEDGGTSNETGESGDTTGEDCTGDECSPLIMEIWGQCGTGDSWSDSGPWLYAAETDHWTTGGLINVDQDTQDPWSEEHTLDSVESSEDNGDGAWDYLEVVLPVVDSPNSQVNDQNTLFNCDTGMENTMMWKITVFDLDGNPADCVVWSGPNGDIGIYGGGCENANNW